MTTKTKTFDPDIDHLDASLQDFEPSSPPPFGYPSCHSGFRTSDGAASSTNMNDSTVSAGGYSPPAWRRLGNGDRSSGFWRRSDNLLGPALLSGHGEGGDFASRESSPEYESADEGDNFLARMRLPAGAISPQNEGSPEPEYHMAPTHIKVEEQIDADIRTTLSSPKEISENCR